MKDFLTKFWDEILGGLILYKTGQVASASQGKASGGGSWLSSFLLTLFPSMTDEDERLWADLTSIKSVPEQQVILLFVEKMKYHGFDESVFILRIIKTYKEWKEKNPQQQYNVADKILSDIVFLNQQGFDAQKEFCLGKKLLVKKGLFKKAFQWVKERKFAAFCYLMAAVLFFLYLSSLIFE